MGDISRHRDIYLNTREAIPVPLLEKSKVSRNDLTYVELGNFFTDISQFRDPVMYIFSKQRIWRDFIIPQTADKVGTLRILSALAAAAAFAAGAAVNAASSNNTVKDIAKYGGGTLGALGGLLAILPTDTYAGIGGADTWVDKMFGTPIERTIGDPKKRDDKHYGYVGQFFRYFIEGITQWIFAQEVPNPVPGEWANVGKIPQAELTKLY